MGSESTLVAVSFLSWDGSPCSGERRLKKLLLVCSVEDGLFDSTFFLAAKKLGRGDLLPRAGLPGGVSLLGVLLPNP